MSRFSVQDTARLRELQSLMGTWTEDTSPIMSQIVAPVRELLDADCSAAYGITVTDDGYLLDYLHTDRIARDPMFNLFARSIAGSRTPWGLFTPDRPEPSQRNLAMRTSDLPGAATSKRKLMAGQVFTSIGVEQHDQMRVLVCDGPVLLGWIGGWRLDRYSLQQRRILQALVPSLRKRLLLERQLGQASLSLLALSATLEHIPATALIVDAQGRVAHANAGGRQLTQKGGRAVEESLRAALGRPDGEFAVTALQANGCATHYLLVARTPPHDSAPRMLLARKRWALTAREAEVLAQLALGHTNKTIASLLRVGERTIEAHVTSLLGKAEVENRASLVARFWIAE